jgi:UDP-N-acetylglucosamine diphosphorylase/glucosamine-1-phosphate N-acetyltransferase
MVAVLFEDETWANYLPLVYTRPVGDLRFGIYTIAEKWSLALNCPVAHRSRSYLRELFPTTTEKDILLINARVMPSEALIEALTSLSHGEALVQGDFLIALRTDDQSNDANDVKREFEGELFRLDRITDLFSKNAQAILEDVQYWSKENKHVGPNDSVRVIGDASRIYIAPSAQVEGCFLNTKEGPIVIDEDAEIMEGAMIRGPFYLGKHAGVKMGAKIYTGTTIGPYSKVGGEISNSLIQGYSNKGHDGFLGNSILGEWCNLGADTNNSNLKNNYSPVKIWNYAANDYIDTGLTFCGLIMGDHSKSGINTMFNTGTVVGVCANIFGAAFPDKYIPSFSWGGADGFEPYQLNKALETAQRMMARRNVPLTPEYIRMLEHIAQLV